MFENKSIKELLELQNVIEAQIKFKTNDLTFWDEQAEIMVFREKQAELEKSIEQFIDSSKISKKIKEAGYFISTHSFCSVSILDFNKEKKENIFYGFNFTKDQGLIKTRDDISEDDFKLIKNILEI